MADGGFTAKDGRANLLRAFKASGCVGCGKRYPEIDWSELHIDHIDPRNAGKWDGRMNRMPTSEALRELLKCQVLCHDCHKRKHNGHVASDASQLALFNGTGAAWRLS